jgi:exopolysaccharide biosynthesis protein
MIIMKKPSTLILIVLICLNILPDDLTAQFSGFKNINWTREKVYSGLIWKSSHIVLPGQEPQNVNILLVNTRKREVALLYNHEKNLSVDQQAESSDALAAVNGGFFNIKDGGSVTYIRTDGRIHESDTALKWKRNINMNGSLLIDRKGSISIEEGHSNEWYDKHTEFQDVLLTGPLLLLKKQKTILPGTSLVSLKHPRTAIGSRNRFRILLVTVDGRTESATGMTLEELTNLMVSLRCRSAVNLDGGGSTTMWIRQKPYKGIVNMPCDNRKFDHEGARAVSDIFIIR